ncbi:MAG: hypothetical protein LBH60_01590 [Prevotellaceae bacterium]|jgi:hypothetical protein|nr:hypothetical protein [Prevotellaceae bacterium]
MIKFLLKISVLAGLSFPLFSCDSGDIYPNEYGSNEGTTVSATFVFDSPDAFPNEYPLIFGAFGDKQSIPLASVRIVMKPKSGEPVKVSIENLTPDATSVMLCLTNLGRLPVFTLFERDINVAGDSIVIPESAISLISYSRIQNLVFEQYNCVSCHQGSAGAGNLLLTADRSYNELVNKVSSVNPAKNRVTPSDTGNSFLLDVLTDDNIGLNHPHTGIITHNDDIVLLREWIKNGCRE